MRGMNQMMVIAALTRDAELRYTPSGDRVMTFSIAVNESWTDTRGQCQEKPHSFEVELWREQAQAFEALKPQKGQPVFVEGAPQSERWTDGEGKKRSTTKISATSALLLKSGEGQAQEGTRVRPPQHQSVAAGADRGGGTTSPAQGAGSMDLNPGLEDFPPQEEDLPF